MKKALQVVSVWMFLAPLAVAADLKPSEIFRIASPSIVVMQAIDHHGKPVAQGSGVVIAPGLIVSNCHVFTQADTAAVVYQKRRYPAVLKHSDVRRDLCSFAVRDLSAPPARLGVTDDLEVGDRAYAIGAPQGLELSLSDGLISSLRPLDGGHVLQITTPISPGSSGGGLFDGKGQLVGITTMYLRESQQLNFAVPVEWIAELPERSVAPPLAKIETPSKDRDASIDVMTKNMPPERYPPGALGISGVTMLIAEVDAQGVVKNVFIEKSSRLREFDEAAKNSVQNWKFRPAIKNGEAVASYVRIPIEFGDVAEIGSDPKESARLGINALEVKLRELDQDGYARRRPLLVREVSNIKATLPPALWPAATLNAYRTISRKEGMEAATGKDSEDRWELVYEEESERTYIDASTMQMQGNYVTVWERTDYSVPQVIAGVERVNKWLLQKRFDCVNRTQELKDDVLYGASDKVLSHFDRPVFIKKSSILPETIGEIVFNAVCEQRKPN